MRKNLKIFNLFCVIVILISIFSTTYASTLSVVRKEADVQYLENNQGYITHKIVSCDSNAGEIKLQITITNTFQEVEDKTPKEVYIIVSENLVLQSDEYIQYCSYIKTLATKVFEKNSNSKIGIIGMQGTLREWITDESGNSLPTGNDQGKIDGSENDGEVVVPATNDINVLTSGLENMNSSKKEYYENLQSAIKLAEKSFSTDSEKILISLFNNVPAISIGTHDEISYGSPSAEYSSAEEGVIARNTKAIANTKAEFLNLKNNGIQFILLRPRNSSYVQTWYDKTTGNIAYKLTQEESEKYVNELYGTFENPTYGKMYSLENSSLEKIVLDYMYSDIFSSVKGIMYSLKLREYFTSKVLQYFKIIVTDPNVDTTAIDNGGYMMWNIDQLNIGETRTLNYTLKVKDMNNKDIVDQITEINDKIELTYTDENKETKTSTGTTSPSVKLVADVVQANNTSTNNVVQSSKDNTTVSTVLPKTGSKIALTIIIGTICIVGIIIYINYRKLDDVK